MHRRSIVIFSAAALAGCAAEAVPPQPGGVPGQSSAAAAASLVGTWSGVWNNDPRFTTSLTIDRVTDDGVLEGRYVFQRQQPFPFRARQEGRSFRFETPTRGGLQTANVFTFTLQPDGRLGGSHQWRDGVNETVLTRA